MYLFFPSRPANAIEKAPPKKTHNSTCWHSGLSASRSSACRSSEAAFHFSSLHFSLLLSTFSNQLGPIGFCPLRRSPTAALHALLDPPSLPQSPPCTAVSPDQAFQATAGSLRKVFGEQPTTKAKQPVPRQSEEPSHLMM